MRCSQVQSLLSAYHDGELDPPAWGRIASHLAVCTTCSAELRALSVIGELLRSDEGCHLPTGLSSRVAGAVRSAGTGGRRGQVWWLPRFAAAAAGFVVYVSLYGVMAASLESGHAEPPVADAQVEQLLHESGLVLAGHGLVSATSSLFENRPEAHFFARLVEEAKP